MYLDIDLPVGVHGEYRLSAQHVDGRLELLHDWTDNIITNGGLDAMFVGGTDYTSHWKRYAVAGTGSTPALPTDTALETPIPGAVSASSSIVRESYGIIPPVVWEDLPDPPYPPYSWYAVFNYTFPVDAVTQVREIGVGEFTTGTALASRCVLDTTVEVPSGATLVVHWRIRFFPNLNAQVQTQSIGGSSYTLTTVPIIYAESFGGFDNFQPAPFNVANASSYREMYKISIVQQSSGLNSLHDITTVTNAGPSIFRYIQESPLSYFGQEVATYHWQTYTTGNYYRDCYMGTEIGYDYDVNTIMIITSAGRWYTSITPTLTRPAYMQLNINFRLSLARYTGPFP